jgi:hypothetical protein
MCGFDKVLFLLVSSFVAKAYGCQRNILPKFGSLFNFKEIIANVLH